MRISKIAKIVEDLIIEGERSRRAILLKTLKAGDGTINIMLLNNVLLDNIMHPMYYKYGPFLD